MTVYDDQRDVYSAGFFIGFALLIGSIIIWLLLLIFAIGVDASLLLGLSVCNGVVLLLVVGAAMLPWREARLFAVRGGGKPGDPARRFELASATRVLTWQYLRPSRWWSLYQPAMPFEEYERQMARLLAVIAARTGLPLYDAR